MELRTELRYEGYGWAEFGNPLIRAGGPTVVTADERGRTVAHMRVAEVPTSPSLEEGALRLHHDVFESINENITYCTLRVETPHGVFISGEHTFRSHNLSFPSGEANIDFHCSRAQFDSSDSAVKYWRLPIWNFHGDLRPAHWVSDLVHPLRLSTSGSATPFELNGEVGFLEVVNGYKELMESQKNGNRNPRIMAALVGTTSGNTMMWSEVKTWFPFDLLNLLGLSSGSRIGSPWIEFFDENASLVRRFHVQLGTSQYEKGDEVLNDVMHSGGLGRLITCAASSTEFGETYLTVALNHILLGNRDSQAMEDKISHFSRALDALAEHFGLGVQNLLEGIPGATKTRVQDLLRSVSAEIRAIACDQEDVGVASALRRIAERAGTNAANVDRDFGLAVLALLKRFKLHDAEVVEAYYSDSPRADGRKWHQALSHYRGLSQHGGTFDFSENEHSPLEVFRFANHLGDIAIRILLKLLGYDGEYQRRNAQWRDSKSLDWVTIETPASELGYKT